MKLTYDLQMYARIHRQGQGKVRIRVKADTDMSTGLALHLGLKDSMEEINHNGLVAKEVIFPGLKE